jgi:hypothetical protein
MAAVLRSLPCFGGCDETGAVDEMAAKCVCRDGFDACTAEAIPLMWLSRLLLYFDELRLCFES